MHGDQFGEFLDIGAKGLKTPIILALTYLYCTRIRVFTTISSAPP